MKTSKFFRRIIELKEDMLGYTVKSKSNYGFCKIEARNEKCRINININGLKPLTDSVYKVNLIKAPDNKVEMVTLGVLEIDDNNNGTMKITTDANQVMGTKNTIEQFDVVAVFMIKPDEYADTIVTPLVGYINEQRDWKKVIDIESIVLQRDSINDKIIEDTPKVNKEEVSEVKEDRTYHKIEEDKAEEEKTEINDIEKEEVESKEAVEINDISDQTFNIIKSQFDKKELKEIYDNIFKEYPSMAPFENKYENHIWVRIEPSDIIYLPIQTWMFTNNPFLLNGYRKYKHLLLGREKEQLTDQYHFLLGVPAIYYPRDKVIAYVYGFKKFVCCQDIKPTSGEYGYWIVEISCNV